MTTTTETGEMVWTMAEQLRILDEERTEAEQAWWDEVARDEEEKAAR